jgi:hypothetical protein
LKTTSDDAGIGQLVERLRLGQGGEIRDGVDLPEQVFDHFTDVFTLAEAIELLHGPGERVLDGFDREIGVVLALLFEALMMTQELLPEELGEALAGRTAERSRNARGVDANQTTLRGHF